MSLKRKAVDITADAAKKSKPNGSITSFFGSQPKSASLTSSSQDGPESAPVSDPGIVRVKVVENVVDPKKNILREAQHRFGVAHEYSVFLRVDTLTPA